MGRMDMIDLDVIATEVGASPPGSSTAQIREGVSHSKDNHDLTNTKAGHVPPVQSSTSKKDPSLVPPGHTYKALPSPAPDTLNKHLRRNARAPGNRKRIECLWPKCSASFMKLASAHTHVCKHLGAIKRFKCTW